jgi:hypothetical protein
MMSSTVHCIVFWSEAEEVGPTNDRLGSSVITRSLTQSLPCHTNPKPEPLTDRLGGKSRQSDRSLSRSCCHPRRHHTINTRVAAATAIIIMSSKLFGVVSALAASTGLAFQSILGGECTSRAGRATATSLHVAVDPTTITKKEYQDICGIDFNEQTLEQRLRRTSFLYPKHVEVIEDIAPIASVMVDEIVSTTSAAPGLFVASFAVPMRVSPSHQCHTNA